MSYPPDVSKVLVIGSSGFLGKRVALALREEGYAVRCSARNLSRVQDLALGGCEIVQGDFSDLASMQRALESVDAAYICVHTLSPQHAATAGQGFMDVELAGVQNIVTACMANGVHRLIYVTFLGTASDAPSEWVRGRWKAEQLFLKSGLDVTVIRPAQIVGIGGFGFNTMVSQAKRPVSINLFGNGRQRMRNIALDDMVYYLVGVLNNPRAYGQCYDVGCDDVLTNNEMIDIAADVLGRPHPFKIDLPRAIVGSLAPLVERAAKMPKGSIKGILDSVKVDSIGDAMPIRAILSRRPLPYRKAVEQALTSAPTSRI